MCLLWESGPIVFSELLLHQPVQGLRCPRATLLTQLAVLMGFLWRKFWGTPAIFMGHNVSTPLGSPRLVSPRHRLASPYLTSSRLAWPGSAWPSPCMAYSTFRPNSLGSASPSDSKVLVQSQRHLRCDRKKRSDANLVADSNGWVVAQSWQLRRDWRERS